MKVLINHQRHTVLQEAAEWLEELQKEHAEFYGTEHGYINRTAHTVPTLGAPKEMTDDFRSWDNSEVMGRSTALAGYIGPMTAAMILMAVVSKYTAGLTPRDILQALTDGSPLGGWMTSAGNLSIVCGTWEYRSGRRHGIRAAIPTAERDSVFYIETHCPTASPDAFGLTPEGLTPEEIEEEIQE